RCATDASSATVPRTSTSGSRGTSTPPDGGHGGPQRGRPAPAPFFMPSHGAASEGLSRGICATQRGLVRACTGVYEYPLHGVSPGQTRFPGPCTRVRVFLAVKLSIGGIST